MPLPAAPAVPTLAMTAVSPLSQGPCGLAGGAVRDAPFYVAVIKPTPLAIKAISSNSVVRVIDGLLLSAQGASTGLS